VEDGVARGERSAWRGISAIIGNLEEMMPDVESIERQIERLDDHALAQLRDWLIEYDHHRWDRQIEADSAAGKLDSLVEEALAEYRAGKTRPL
jgi:hypothetical protein